MTATRGTELSVRDRVLAFCQRRVSSWWPRVRILPTHRTIVQETIPKANLPRTSRTSKRRAAGRKPCGQCCGTDDALRGVDLQVVFGLSSGCVEKELSDIMRKEAPQSTIFYYRFGLGCVRFFDRRVTLEELCVAHVTPLIL